LASATNAAITLMRRAIDERVDISDAFWAGDLQYRRVPWPDPVETMRKRYASGEPNLDQVED
jgi:hypothetical protein